MHKRREHDARTAVAVKREVNAPPPPRSRILVVDDDDRNLLAISVVLESVADVVCARSGEEALRFILKEEFAVILLDVFMPGMDGYETATLIRQREQSKRTPIIFLTAMNKEDSHMLRGYDTGAVDYVFKPFEPVILKSKVSVFVDLFEKAREIQQKAATEQRLLEENLRVNTERLRIEQELRQSEERQALIMKALPVCFHSRATEPPFGARYVSAAIEQLTGFPPERLTDEPEFGLSRVHPEDLPRVTRALKGALEGGSYSVEFRWRCADETYRVFLDQGVLSESGMEIFGTLLDITERRLLEDQLFQAQKLDAIGKLTGGVAHDFNNLLAAVLGGLGLIERRVEVTDEVRKVIDMTRHAAKQGAELINRMLAFSRRQQLRPGVVRLGELTSTMNSLVAPVLGGLVRCEWKVAGDLWPAYADGGQLELALMNLILNARDAMPTGGTVTIRAGNRTTQHDEEALAAGDYVVIMVEDTGSGIEPEHVPRVIEPFFTTKDVGKGTGLGLSTVYGFAKQSGGTLRIDSTVGRGTEVELWLPRARQEPSEEALPAPVSAEAPASDEGERPTILLVDDSTSLREVTAGFLRDRDYEVITAGGGAEALAMIEREPEKFDLIVTDFAMPLVSGIEVIRFARNLRADWPAILITGYADITEISNRPDDVPLLNKPFAETALVDTITKVMRKSRAGRTRAAEVPNDSRPKARAAGS
jgi:signal transduction histidine kinase/DNA-binding response OmpR family regulator